MVNLKTLLTVDYGVEVLPGDPDELFEYQKEIGVGSYGTVYKAIQKKEKRPCAVKVVALDADEEESIEALVAEIQILSICNSEYIVHYYGTWVKGGLLFHFDHCHGIVHEWVYPWNLRRYAWNSMH
jgi:serine/threonine protein kinase